MEVVVITADEPIILSASSGALSPVEEEDNGSPSTD